MDTHHRVTRRIRTNPSKMSKNTDQFIEGAIPLIAEDLRNSRARLGITSAKAAKRAGINASRYRMLESGRAHRNKPNVAAIISAAGRLGLESVRVCYADFIDQYIRVVVVENGPLTIFFDTLDSSVAQLKEQGHFVSPYRLLDFVRHEGFGPILDSRQRLDKLLVELWVTAIFTLCLPDDREYYVRAARTDPPDTEVMMVDKETRGVEMVRVEITQHGMHSASVTDVIGKKLMKRYQDGTVLVVFVEHSQELSVVELYEFVRKNNPHRQQIFIIGGVGNPNKFKVIPWRKVTTPTPGEIAWSEITVDTKDRRKASCMYDGAVFKPPHMSRFPYAYPVFVRTLKLRR